VAAAFLTLPHEEVPVVPEAVRWAESGDAVDILDQTRLPEEEVRLRIESTDAMVEAIGALRVRGAPAIGIAAALALALDAAQHTKLEPAAFAAHLSDARARLLGARPTAVNLGWALERLERLRASLGAAPNGVVACKLWGEATAILEEDRAMCRAIGEHGLTLLAPGARVLTHCNAGALATGGIGTALAPIYLAHERGLAPQVFADETRPLLQGSRLTAWELTRAGIPVTLVTDSVAAVLMAQGRIDAVVVGADRIAANGDVANKVGTYGLAVQARHHGVPFYVAAPTSTLDVRTATGADIPIEVRSADEVRRGFGRLTAPADVPVYAPAFDVTPAELITAIITDRGVLQPPFAEGIARIANQAAEVVA
jgi:methylthioribose-1-phosphate isomerase